jgi:predicted nuclease with TOPRIM domain
LEQQKLWKLQKTEYKNWRKKQMSKKLEKEIEELKKRIEELEGKQPKPEPAKLPFWMPTKDEEKYYYLAFHGVDSTTFESGYQYDQQKIAIGNYFKTEELAQKHVDKLKLLEEIKQWRGKHDPESFKLDWEDEDSDKWELVWNVREALWDLKEASDLRSPLGIYFGFDANIHYFLEHFGKRLNILLEVD